MCGLAGFLIKGRGPGDPSAILQAMGRAIRHRGPDDGDQWFDPEAGIGFSHRRLAIVDLSAAGHQPMASYSGRYVTVFNGEIYNHMEIRARLSSRAIPWRGHSDTQTLLEATEAWGVMPALRECVGMFAAAIWDRQTRTLYLMRDRLGEKPLYYGWNNGTFLFGSELKALRAYPAFAAEIDRNALALYLAFNYVPSPRSIFRGIGKLPPGAVLVLPSEAEPGDEHIEYYWSFAEILNRERFGGSSQEAADQLELLLSRAIALQQMSDVPLGCFLSGGIDSSTIAALMQKQSRHPIRTFAIGFKEEAFNEAHHAAAVARHLGTDHTELIVSARDALELVPCIPDIWDEPFADSSQLPTTLVASLARKKVTVCLSGDAGDELFGGYNHYALSQSLERVPAKPFAAALLRVAPLALVARIAHGAGLRGVTERRLRNVEHVLGARTRRARYLMLMAQWKDPASLIVGATARPQDITQFSPPGTLDDLNAISALDVMTYLPDDILAKVDRAAMSASLETRVPLLDHRIVEFAFSLPEGIKVHHGIRKSPLREILARYVPAALTERPKQGFGVPIGAWLRGPLRDWAANLLSPESLARSALSPAPITALWQEHQAGTPYLESRLWNILMYQAWAVRNNLS
jgi:asparagine synthase (glutamine-hydrolysing)